jgi:hypothetical protein
LRAYYTDSIDFGSKRETEMALHRFALINLDEFDSIRLGQQPYLKHLLQKPDANIRRPHKSSIVAEKRYGAFIATCNHFDLLSDPTGSRRFLCVKVDGQIRFPARASLCPGPCRPAERRQVLVQQERGSARYGKQSSIPTDTGRRAIIPPVFYVYKTGRGWRMVARH